MNDLSNRLSLLSKLSFYANNGIKLYESSSLVALKEEGTGHMAENVDDDRDSLSERRFGGA